MEISPGTGSNCCNVDNTKTAVYPNRTWPDTKHQFPKWIEEYKLVGLEFENVSNQRSSERAKRPPLVYSHYIPSEGCSKPQSPIALNNSGFNKKSLKPVAWIPT